MAAGDVVDVNGQKFIEQEDGTLAPMRAMHKRTDYAIGDALGGVRAAAARAAEAGDAAQSGGV